MPKPPSLLSPKPQPIWVELKYFTGYDFEGTVDDAIALLTALKADYPDRTLRLDWREARYEDSYRLYVDEQRLETPEEVTARVNEAKRIKALQEERERREFERLSAKFQK